MIWVQEVSAVTQGFVRLASVAPGRALLVLQQHSEGWELPCMAGRCLW